MRLRTFLLTVFLFNTAAIAAQTPTTPNNDFQVWNETTVAFPIVKKEGRYAKSVDRVSLLLLGTLRFGQNRLFPVDERIGFGFDFKLSNYFTFTPSYLYRHVEPGRGRNATEHEIRFEGTFEKTFKSFSIKARPRIEYHVRNSRSDFVSFRNKFTLKVPIKSNDKEIFSPFIAEEPFYDFSAKRWNANEFSAGVSKKLNKTVSAEFFYMLRNVHASLPKTTNAIGVNLRFRID
jgi:uncharacterized protein DUF2490